MFCFFFHITHYFKIELVHLIRNTLLVNILKIDFSPPYFKGSVHKSKEASALFEKIWSMKRVTNLIQAKHGMTHHHVAELGVGNSQRQL